MATKASRSDVAFHRRLKAMVEWLQENMEAKGYDKEYVKGVLVKMLKRWTAIYTQCLDKQYRNKAMIIEKRAVRKEAAKVYAEGVRMIKANEKTTDAERITLEIAPNAPFSREPIPVTNTAPVMSFIIAVAMQILIYFRESDAKRKGLPAGAGGIEFRWAVLPDVPHSIEELTNILFITKGKLLLTFKEEDRGKFVRLAARWISPSGEQGAWTLIMSVMIPLEGGGS
jgi:hypothetical protein